MPGKVEEFITNKLNVTAKVKTAGKINTSGRTDMILAEVEPWDKKQEILRAKKKLKDTTVYIENDLTKIEREIQWEIRKIAN